MHACMQMLWLLCAGLPSCLLNNCCVRSSLLLWMCVTTDFHRMANWCQVKWEGDVRSFRLFIFYSFFTINIVTIRCHFTQARNACCINVRIIFSLPSFQYFNFMLLGSQSNILFINFLSLIPHSSREKKIVLWT